MRSLLLLPLLGLSAFAAAPNLAVNGGFEAAEGWNLVCQDQATGTADRVAGGRAGQAMRLTKTNGLGFLRLVSAQPVHVEPNVKYTFRGWFHSEDAPLSSLLLFRAGPGTGNLYYDSIDRSAGWMSQSLLINSPAGQWEKRVITFKSAKAADIWLNVGLWGNPCTVLLDDLEFTAEPYRPQFTANHYLPSASPEEAERALAARPPLDGRVRGVDGRSRLELAGRPVAPVLFKTPNYQDAGDQMAFHQDGVDTDLLPIQFGGTKDTQGLWLGAGKYDFTAADRTIQLALQRNPQARLVLDLWLYPYRTWGDEHPTECWANDAGERAYGWWGNLEGFTTDLAKLPPGRKYWWYPSYESPVWKADAAAAITAFVQHVRTTPAWKAVVGFMLTGGHDGQFQVLAERDRSPAALGAWREWLRRTYGGDADRSRRRVPPTPTLGAAAPPAGEDRTKGMETLPPFLAPGLELDYRRFEVEQSWLLRETFAATAKAAAGKSVFTVAYGMPPGYDFSGLFALPHLDASASMSYYPYRNPGYAPGYRMGDGFALHDKLFVQELDVRSWGEPHDEVYEMWIGRGETLERWRSVMRKLIGVSLAHQHGYWYYDMNTYFADPRLHAEIRTYQALTERLTAGPASTFRPDVVLVTTPGAELYHGAYFSSVKHAETFYETMELEASGVPYDVHQLDDILARPELQRYKVYLFLHTPYLSEAQREGIAAKLKRDGHTLVFGYGSGYVTDDGTSAEALTKVTGIRVATQEGYTRNHALLLSDQPLTAGLPPFCGLAELQMSIMHTAGASGFAARYQGFRVDDPGATPLAKYAEDGTVAAALKPQGGWTSVYLGPPAALGGALLNRLAGRAGAFTAGPPQMAALAYGGRFISLHGLRSGPYPLRLPTGARRLVDADTGQRVGTGPVVTVPVVAQRTDWYLVE